MSRNHRQDDGGEDPESGRPRPRSSRRAATSTLQSAINSTRPAAHQAAPGARLVPIRRSKPTSPVTRAESPKLGSIVVLPPDTGGMTASSSPLATGSDIVADSPLRQTAAVFNPAANDSPKRELATARTSPTVSPSTSTRDAPELAEVSKKAEGDHERRVIGRQAGGSTRNPRRVSS